MTAFSSEWLQLREPADTAARNRDIASAVQARFALRDTVFAVDLGCGSGANVRATQPLLPNQQTWRLVDSDATLLKVAREELAHWADSAEMVGPHLNLKKGSATLWIEFSNLDLSAELDAALAGAPTLITASALFDLTSVDFIRRLARRTVDLNAAFYTVLTFDGQQRWTPHRPADNQIAAAFLAHQLTDKGFGVAAGPTAPAHLADQFRLNGYSVLEGDSPWLLGPADRMLIEELMRGYAMAAAETNRVDAKTLEAWVKVKRTAAMIGHTDTFAVPT